MNDVSAKDACLVLHIVSKYPNVNRTSLNKILFFLDAGSFRKTGTRLADFGYTKMPFGPVPDGIRTVIRSLKRIGLLREEVVPEGPYAAYNYSVIPSAKLDMILQAATKIFTQEQLALIDDGLKGLRTKTASELSSISHDFDCWVEAEWNAPINIAEAASDPHLDAALATEPLVFDETGNFGLF